MAALADHLENVLNESRMLLLGGQVLLGFSYRICFEKRFEQMAFAPQLAELIALAIMTAALGWLIWPAAFHQIAEAGRLTTRAHDLTSMVLDFALLPMGLGTGLALYPVATALNIPRAWAFAAATFAFAMFAWYGSALLRSKKHPEHAKSGSGGDVGERIKKVLIECRMALPGAQAFLGFQFSIVFVEGFDRLPRHWQRTHFASLLATTISIVLLIAPAAYHRLAEHGEDTEHFHRVASGLLLAALVFLAPGMCGDLWLVLAKIAHSEKLATAVSLSFLAVFWALWFGVSALRRR